MPKNRHWIVEFDEKDGSSFVTKSFDRTPEYALTFLRQNLTHLFRLGFHNQCRFLGYGPEEVRTPDNSIKSRVLYQLSYGPFETIPVIISNFNVVG